ncbi:MAG: type II toxin-antitoxin system HicB family antitoxin, partial [Bacteroidales bacterium]|nr:type II toxin-antitoxin system HicB family antitoxin [Bacteroidales bacterium]
HAVIEKADANYSAYVEELTGVGGVGDTLDEVKTSLEEALVVLKEACIDYGDPIPEELQGEYQIVFRMDTKSFLQMYCKIFTKSALERLTGINQKQLWHYANGLSKPRPAQVKKIERALHQLGEELLSLEL